MLEAAAVPRFVSVMVAVAEPPTVARPKSTDEGVATSEGVSSASDTCAMGSPDSSTPAHPARAALTPMDATTRSHEGIRFIWIASDLQPARLVRVAPFP